MRIGLRQSKLGDREYPRIALMTVRMCAWPRRYFSGDAAAIARSSSGVRHSRTDAIRRIVRYERIRSSCILSAKAWSSTLIAF